MPGRLCQRCADELSTRSSSRSAGPSCDSGSGGGAWVVSMTDPPSRRVKEDAGVQKGESRSRRAAADPEPDLTSGSDTESFGVVKRIFRVSKLGPPPSG